MSKKRAKDSRPCADFSGSWRGICTRIGEEPQEELMVVEQCECRTIRFDGGSEFPLMGSTSQTTDTVDGESFHLTGQMRWNSSRTAFDIFFAFSIGSAYPNYRTIVNGKSKYWLEDGKLRVENTMQAKSDLIPDQTVVEACTYERQP